MSGGQPRRPTFDVFVGNLKDNSDDSHLRETFSEYGEINSVYIKEGKQQGQGAFFAFVRFNCEEAANKAAKDANGRILNGLPIVVRRSQPRNKPAGILGVPAPQTNTLTNKPDLVANHQMKQKSPGMKKPGRLSGDPSLPEHVMVTHIDGPLKFWVQNIEPQGTQEMQAITENLQVLCPSASNVVGTPLHDKIYATRFSEDGVWYRCKVLKAVSDTESQVFYVDYGNGEVKPNCDIVELLPNQANIKPQATACVLYGLKPIEGKQVEGINKLHAITNGRQLKAQYMAPIMSPSPSAKSSSLVPCILTDEESNTDINQEMLNAGFGERRFTTNQKPPRSPQQQLPTPQQPPPQLSLLSGPMSSPARPMPGGPLGRGTLQQPMADFGGEVWDNNTNTTKSNDTSFSATLKSLERTAFSWVGSVPPPPMNSLASVPPPVSNAGDGGPSWAEMKAIRAEMAQQCERQQREAEARQGEQNKLLVELAAVKGKFKNLQMEYNTVQSQLQQSGLNHKVDNLTCNVQTVKLLRKQFPSGDQNCDVVNHCLDLLRNEDSRIDLESMEVITNVKAALNPYHFIQNKVKEAGDLSKIPDLLPARDGARKQLHLRLGEFVTAVAEVPFKQRGQQLTEALQQLQATYHVYLDQQTESSKTLEEVYTLYHDWKNSKISDFEDVRTRTNTEHNAINSALRLLIQQLCLMEQSPSESMMKVSNLDALLQSFNTALADEIVKTNMQESITDAPTVSLVVQSLGSLLRGELQQIEQLRALHTQYSTMQSELAPWLTEKPSVEDLLATRKQIKALKSKLRHMLADKIDLEENEEGSENELETLKSELVGLRVELQTAFHKEDTFLAELCEIHEKHFPELSLQHPEAGIDSDQNFGGLVKSGWSLEHFDLQPLENAKSSLQKTTFMEQPVVIKEYIIDESSGKKAEVLRRASAFFDVKNDHIIPIQALFMSKNERQVYVQLAFYTESLASRAAQGPFTDKEQYEILRDLLEGISAIHKARLVHGCIHPANIFLDADNRAILADYDITKSLEQRAEKCFVSPHGLNFMSPEATKKEAITRSTDMFGLGVIAYWLHCPEAATLSEFTKSSENGPLEQLLHYLLNPDPQRRCSAVEAANFPYFTSSPFLCTPCSSPPPTIAMATEMLDARPRQSSPRLVSPPGGGILKSALSPRNSICSPSARVSIGDTTVVGVADHSEDESQEDMVEGGPPPDLIQHETEDEVSTPLPCTPMGTPVNTPIEGAQCQGEEEDPSVRELVTSAAEQAAMLVEQLDGSEGRADTPTEAAPAGDVDVSITEPPIMSNDEVLAQATAESCSIENESEITEL